MAPYPSNAVRATPSPQQDSSAIAWSVKTASHTRQSCASPKRNSDVSRAERNTAHSSASSSGNGSSWSSTQALHKRPASATALAQSPNRSGGELTPLGGDERETMRLGALQYQIAQSEHVGRPLPQLVIYFGSRDCSPNRRGRQLVRSDLYFLHARQAALPSVISFRCCWTATTSGMSGKPAATAAALAVVGGRRAHASSTRMTARGPRPLLRPIAARGRAREARDPEPTRGSHRR